MQVGGRRGTNGQSRGLAGTQQVPVTVHQVEYICPAQLWAECDLRLLTLISLGLSFPMYTVRLPKPSLDFSLVAVTFCLDSWSLAPCSLGISKCSGDSHRESLGCLSTVLFSPGAHPSAPPWNPRSPALFLQPLEGVSHSSWFCLSTSVSGGTCGAHRAHCIVFSFPR